MRRRWSLALVGLLIALSGILFARVVLAVADSTIPDDPGYVLDVPMEDLDGDGQADE